MLTLVTTILTDSNSVGKPWRPQFEASCLRHDLAPVPLNLKDFNPTNGGLKLKALASACIERRNTHTHVLFLDGFDSIVLDSLAELQRRFLAFNKPMVVAGAAKLVPKLPSLFSYPLSESGSPFIYPRANIFMAELPYFLQLLSKFSLHETRGPFVDNEWFQHVYANSPSAFVVDNETSLFITLDGASPDMFDVDSGRVVNKVNGKLPSVIHASGTFNFAGVLQRLVGQGHYYLGNFKSQLRTTTPTYHDPEVARMRLKTTAQRPWCYDYASVWKQRAELDGVQPPEPALARKLTQYRGKLALDYGAGAGRYSPLLASQFERVIAVDVEKSALDQLRKRQPTIRLEVVSGPHLSAVQDDEVDFILAWDVLSFVDFNDLVAILREFERVLAVDGRLVLNLCSLHSLNNAALLDGDSASTCPARVRPYTKDAVRLLIKQRGLELLGLVDEGSSLVVTARKRSRLVRRQRPLQVTNFYHSGDAGDIIYALPTIKAMGGGRLYLGPEVNIKYEAATRLKMTEAAFANIKPVVEAQPYIHSCCFADVYPEGLINVNLNEFRVWLIDHQTGNYWNNPNFDGTLSLAQVHLSTFNVGPVDETEPWITLPEKANLPEGCDIVVARSQRYNNLRFPWLQLVQAYGHRMCFVGLDAEFDEFTSVVGKVKIKRVKTASLYEVATTVAAAKLFIGNQSCPFAIAEGLKVPAVQETWDHDPNCMFNRPTALYQCDDFDTIVQFMRRFLDA